jgi:hypothetical protein
MTRLQPFVNHYRKKQNRIAAQELGWPSYTVREIYPEFLLVLMGENLY